jgi:hypothetical protein
MRLYRYQNFIKESKKDIESICKKYNIQNYTINEDGSIDVDGSVNLKYKGLSELPLKFRKVSGNFFCYRNKLTSLVGSPKEVGGNFDCNNNQLLSLEGAPREVGRDFYCQSNQLTSLVGSPNKVDGYFVCSENKLTRLEGISQKIGGSIYCENNEIRDVKGIKDGWSGGFHIAGNPVYEIFSFFPKKRRDEVVELLNEFDVIRGKLVILQGLEQIFLEMELEVPEIEKIEGYDIQY